jgi:hypothetical protein
MGRVISRRFLGQLQQWREVQMNLQSMVTHSLVFVLGVSIGLILALVGGNLWVVSVFVLGLGLILGYYARKRPA